MNHTYSITFDRAIGDFFQQVDIFDSEYCANPDLDDKGVDQAFTRLANAWRTLQSAYINHKAKIALDALSPSDRVDPDSEDEDDLDEEP